MSLACFGMGLTLEEALVGATINAACVARSRTTTVGSLEAGKQLDAVVVDGAAIELMRVGRAGDPRGRSSAGTVVASRVALSST